MKKNVKNLFSIVFVSGLLFASCKGPDGPTGPRGLQGEQGIQGPEGTANVIYSGWIPANWNVADLDYNKVMYIEEERVTGDFMNTGTLLVYMQLDASVIITLPYANFTLSIQSLIIDTEISGEIYKGMFIVAEQQDGTSNPPDLPSWVPESKIRYVMIPDGIPAKLPPGFFDDYHNVQEFFGIPD